MPTDVYQDPLVGRYTSKAMQHIWSEDFKFQTWRRCWIALAESEMELGLTQITLAMIDEMKAHQNDINYDVAKAKEKEIRHDVMAHVYAYGQQCPLAAGIMHLGATSMEPDDNTVLVQERESLGLVVRGIVNTIYNLRNFADEYKGMACLGYTHFQAAQPVTVGKRATLYISDLLADLDQIEHVRAGLMARGAKGTVGTQASFLELFDGDHEKVKALDRLFSEKLGFNGSYHVTGQTYSRKVDELVAYAVAGLGSSAHKFGLDMRLLSNQKEIEEPFEKNQTGSSAMAYKRNPMRSERMCAISRKLMGLPADFEATHATQLFERTLDDSAIRRMDLPQLFLTADAVLTLYQNITKGMVVYPAMIKKHLAEELPFMATEAILMDLAKKGHSRQEMHEKIKVHSVAAGKRVKMEGAENDLFERLANDPDFPADADYFKGLLDDPKRFTGRAEEQVVEYLAEVVDPVLDKYKDLVGKSDSEVKV